MSKKPNSSPDKKAGSKSRPSRKMKKLSKGSHFVVSSADPRVLSKRKVPDGTIVIVRPSAFQTHPRTLDTLVKTVGRDMKSAMIEVAREDITKTPPRPRKKRRDMMHAACAKTPTGDNRFFGTGAPSTTQTKVASPTRHPTPTKRKK